jgi:GH15 family glucan-1,4-alpha-glucosidase
LLWLGVPFGVVEPTGDLYRTTVARIRDELLVPGGGVRRYLGDTVWADTPAAWAMSRTFVRA